MLRQKENSNKSHIILYTEVFFILRDVTGHSNVFLVTTGFPDNKEEIFSIISLYNKHWRAAKLVTEIEIPVVLAVLLLVHRQLSDRGVFSWKDISRATESFPVILQPWLRQCCNITSTSFTFQSTISQSSEYPIINL